MKLISLQLMNFRQFYGLTPLIKFASGSENTTVIHGNNGAGKTTILNAFTWIFYEQFTAAFAAPDLLVNKRAINELEIDSYVDCFAEVIFEHDYKTYQLKRKFSVYKDSNNQRQTAKSQLFMMIAGDDGKWYHPREQPEDIIEKILPKSLHQYFFFDGEHIDHIFRSTERHKIAEDTKELIGVKVLERAITHLENAKKSLKQELNQLGNIEIKQLLKQQQDLDRKKEKRQSENKLIQLRLQKLEQEKKTTSEELLAMGGIENLQQLKQKLISEEKETRATLVEQQNLIKKELSRQGYTVFLKTTIQKFQALIEDLRQKGELPSGIKQQFVQQLLNQQRCICGTELYPETIPYHQVQTWMNKAGIAEIEEAAIRLETEVNNITSQTEQFWTEIDQYQSKINQGRTQLAMIENQLDELKEKLRKYPDQNIQSAQKKLDNLEQHIRQLTLNQGEINLQIETLTEEISNLDKQIQKQEIKLEKQELVLRRIQAVESAIKCINKVKKRLENQFRLALEIKVQKIFNSISFTPYQPRLNQNYELNLIENTSGKALPVAASTGENQILSLSFIGAIIELVREWSKESNLMGPDSSQFPVIMDSPFGSLDEIYRRQVAQSIPRLANQLVVLVSKTQWRNEVETEMNNYIGRQYVLVYHSPKDDCQVDSIILNNVEYPLVKQSENQFEYTEIIEITS
jgi:DNA sulfur modification protein DndD